MKTEQAGDVCVVMSEIKKNKPDHSPMVRPKDLNPATTAYDPEDVVEDSDTSEKQRFPEEDQRESRKMKAIFENVY